MGDYRVEESPRCRGSPEVDLIRRRIDSMPLGSACPASAPSASSGFGPGSQTETSGAKVCRRCNGIVTLKELEESVKVTSSDNQSEDCVDGTPRSVKVIIKCQCESRLSFVRNYTGTFVLDGSCVMRRYASTKGAGRDIPKDMKVFHLGTMEMCITNPHVEGAEMSVMVGALVTSLEDENGHIRHFIDEVIPGSPAADMELRCEDELMLCNSQLLVNKTADQVAMIFADVQIDQEFTLLTRRITNRRSALDLNNPEDIQYEYWQIRATITVDAEHLPILAETAFVTRATKGDILDVHFDKHFKDGQKVRIKLDRGYLKNTDGVLTVGQLRSDDATFIFDMFSCDMTVMDNGPNQYRVRLFRYSPSSGRPSFFYVSKTGNIKLKEVPHKKYSKPSRDIFMNDRCSGDYCVRNTVFISSDVSRFGEEYYLEAFVKRNLYMSNKKGVLELFRVEDKHDLPYTSGVSFEVILM